MGEYNLRQEQAAAKAAGVRFDVGIVRLHASMALAPTVARRHCLR